MTSHTDTPTIIDQLAARDHTPHLTPTTPADHTAALNHTDPVARARTARDSRNPAELHTLAGDPSADVRIYTAGNPHATPATLHMLAADLDPEVREAVAHNRATPTTTLTKLAADPDTNVRWGVATNPHTPTTTLTHIEHADPDPDISYTTSHIRRNALAAHRATLTGPARDHADLLLPTFTGWPDQLDHLLATLP